MTTTPSTELQEILAARRGDGLPPAMGGVPDDLPPVDLATGEIMPVLVGEPPPPVLVREPDYSLIPPKVLGALPFAADYVKLAKTISNTEMVPAPLRGRYDAIAAIFFKGYEMGMGPMQALDSFDVIQGQVALKPEAMRALIMYEGHLFIVREGVAPEGRFAEVEARRNDWPDSQPNETYRYGMDDAQLAGLSGKDNWKKMPRAMLDARATGGAARRYFSDVIQGMSYTVGEVMDFTGGEPSEALTEPPPATAEPAATKVPEVAAEAPTEPADQAAAKGTAEPPKRKRGRPTKAETEARKVTQEQAAKALAEGRARDPLEPEPGPPEPPVEPEPVERVPDPEQSPLVGTLLPPDPQVPDVPDAPPLLPGEAGVIGELRKSLAAVIQSQPDLQQTLLRSFLARHFPGKKAVDLDADELTLAINIAGGWPESATTYPAPEPEAAEF